MKDCQLSHSDDEAREMRIGYLTMLLHTAKTEEKRAEVLRELDMMRQEKQADVATGAKAEQFMLVPVEPTREILEAMGAVPERPTAGYLSRVYEALIEAAKEAEINGS